MRLTTKNLKGRVYSFVLDSLRNFQHGYIDYFHEATNTQFPPTRKSLELIKNYKKTDIQISPVVVNYLDQEDKKRKVFLDTNNYYDQKLYEHQNVGVNFGIANYKYNQKKIRLILADDPRLGKSAQALKILDYFKNEHSGNKLILCPKALTAQWEHYVKEWTDFSPVVVLGNAYKRSQIFRMGEKSSDLIFITNFETLNSHNFEQLNFEWDFIIADEAHRFKNRKSKTVKNFRTLKYKSLILISATFIENMPDDYWSPLNLLDSIMFGSYWRFAGHYCDTVEGSYGLMRLGVKNSDILKEQLTPYVLQRKSDEVANMPEKIYETVFCETEKWHLDYYKKIQDVVFLDLSDGNELTIPNQISRMIRLKQASLHPILIDKEYKAELKIGKFATAYELISELNQNEQVIIYSSFVKGCEIVNEVLKEFGSFVYVGEHANTENISKFQNGEYRIMCTTPQKGGIGLNLFNANYCIFLDLPYSSILLRQAEERIRSVGKKGPVKIINLQLQDSIDTIINDMLENKLSNIEETDILYNLKRFINEIQNEHSY